MTEPLFLTVDEAAAHLAVHPETIRRAIRRGELACYRRRGCTRIAPEHLQAYMDAAFCPARGSASSTSNGAATAGPSSSGKAVTVADFRLRQRLKAAADRPVRTGT